LNEALLMKIGQTYPNYIRLVLIGFSPHINEQIRQFRAALIYLRSMNPSFGSCVQFESCSSQVEKQNKLTTSRCYLAAKAFLYV
jgi:hypothetical protein